MSGNGSKNGSGVISAGPATGGGQFFDPGVSQPRQGAMAFAKGWLNGEN